MERRIYITVPRIALTVNLKIIKCGKRQIRYIMVFTFSLGKSIHNICLLRKVLWCHLFRPHIEKDIVYKDLKKKELLVLFC